MRTKEQLLENAMIGEISFKYVIIEILLDIRDLLQIKNIDVPPITSQCSCGINSTRVCPIHNNHMGSTNQKTL